jgi:hypothetical protein
VVLYVSFCSLSLSILFLLRPPIVQRKHEVISNTVSQSNCLTDGVFYTCAPSDLACLCAKDQPLIDQYVDAITPCLESEDRKNECTDGALYRK